MQFIEFQLILHYFKKFYSNFIDIMLKKDLEIIKRNVLIFVIN